MSRSCAPIPFAPFVAVAHAAAAAATANRMALTTGCAAAAAFPKTPGGTPGAGLERNGVIFISFQSATSAGPRPTADTRRIEGPTVANATVGLRFPVPRSWVLFPGSLVLRCAGTREPANVEPKNRENPRTNEPGTGNREPGHDRMTK